MIPTHLHGSRILIGEHDADTRSRLHLMLDSFGAKVAEAATNRWLMATLVEQGPFDAVISDRTMQPPSCADMIALTRGAGVDVAFIVTRYRDPNDLQRGVVRLGEPSDDERVATELDRALIAPHPIDLAACDFVACAACGRAHIAELWPPMPSLCVRCIEAADGGR